MYHHILRGDKPDYNLDTEENLAIINNIETIRPFFAPMIINYSFKAKFYENELTKPTIKEIILFIRSLIVATTIELGDKHPSQIPEIADKYSWCIN